MNKPKSALLAGVLLLMAGTTSAQDGQKPQYGGTLDIGTVYITLSALSWDPHDWNWKLNHDTGQYLEQLFQGDLGKARSRGGKHAFVADGYLAQDAIKGELAESFEWKDNPLRVEIKLRQGVMFPDKPGVMKSRELTSQDVAYSFNRLISSPKQQKGYFSHVINVETPDKYTVVFNMKHFHAEWDYRFGWGYYSPIYAKEMVDAGATNWKNAVGTGPFQLTDFVSGNSNTYTKNPIYWGTEKIGGQDYKLPFVDKIVYRTMKDEAT